MADDDDDDEDLFAFAGALYPFAQGSNVRTCCSLLTKTRTIYSLLFLPKLVFSILRRSKGKIAFDRNLH